MINDSKKCVLLSDQTEYTRHRNVFNFETAVIAITRPNVSKSDVLDCCGLSAENVYTWDNVADRSYNPFAFDINAEERVRDIIKMASWPQSYEEVMRSDQYSHVDVSGRFFQRSYNKEYLDNSFCKSFELAVRVIGDVKPDFVYTEEYRDVNKIAFLCACLIKGVRFFCLEPTNYKSNYFLRSFSKKGEGVLSEYFGYDGSVNDPRLIASCIEKHNEIDGKVEISWDTSIDSSEVVELEGNVSSIKRDDHHGQHKVNDRVNLFGAFYDFIRLFFDQMYRFLRSVANLNVMLNNRVIPWHKKNTLDYLVSSFEKSRYLLQCKMKAIGYALLPGKKIESLIEDVDYIVCLHYFPESTTISGLSWHGVKNEIDLFSIPAVQKVLTTDNTLIIEHPVYMVRGERSSYFWKSLKNKGYDKVYKYNYGVDFGLLSKKYVVSIAGSVALESALGGGQSYLVKNSILLNIYGVNHISDRLNDSAWDIDFKNKVAASSYVKTCSDFGFDSSLAADVCYSF